MKTRPTVRTISCTKKGALPTKGYPQSENEFRKQARQQPQGGIRQPQDGEVAQVAAHAILAAGSGGGGAPNCLPQ